MMKTVNQFICFVIGHNWNCKGGEIIDTQSIFKRTLFFNCKRCNHKTKTNAWAFDRNAGALYYYKNLYIK